MVCFLLIVSDTKCKAHAGLLVRTVKHCQVTVWAGKKKGTCIYEMQYFEKF